MTFQVIDQEQLQIKGITYDVLEAKPYRWNGIERTYLRLKRPRGRKNYLVFGYENGTFSDPITLPKGA